MVEQLSYTQLVSGSNPLGSTELVIGQQLSVSRQCIFVCRLPTAD